MFKTINSEKGIALVVSLMVLVALTLMGIAAIMTSSLDMRISGNEKVAMQAAYASEAGIAEALGRLNLDSADPNSIAAPSTPNPPWPATWANNTGGNYNSWEETFNGAISAIDVTEGVSYNYSVTISYKDLDTDRVAFYNQTSGYSNADTATGGNPVYQIVSVGSSGSYRSRTSLEVTKEVYNYQIRGGLNANGPIQINGSPTVDGNAHTADGTAGQGTCNTASLTGNLPAVNANGATTVVGGGGTVDPAPVNDATYTVADPWTALGITQGQFNTLFTTKDISYTGAPAGNIWIGGTGTVSSANPNTQNYDANPTNGIAGSGILVVHNPNFVPGSCPGDLYTSPDPANVCYREKAPAILDVNKGTFKGVIIADQVNLAGNVTIIGSIISLTTVVTSATASGNPSIIYSCEAIEKFAGGKIKSKLAWNRLEN